MNTTELKTMTLWVIIQHTLYLSEPWFTLYTKT